MREQPPSGSAMLGLKAAGKSVHLYTFMKVNTSSAIGSHQGLCSKPKFLHLFSHGHHTSLNWPYGAQNPQLVEVTILLAE